MQWNQGYTQGIEWADANYRTMELQGGLKVAFDQGKATGLASAKTRIQKFTWVGLLNVRMLSAGSQ